MINSKNRKTMNQVNIKKSFRIKAMSKMIPIQNIIPLRPSVNDVAVYHVYVAIYM